MTAKGFDQAFQAIQKLATDFQASSNFYLSSAYSEAQARKDFIDKFFIALGWDVNNEHHPNPFEQEVKVERGVSVGLAQRHADYAFHVEPRFHEPRFIVEAKKPFGELATADNCFQTIRYAWNLETPLAGLTDFEQFHLLDCRYTPNIDSAIDRCQEKWSLQDYFDRDKFARLYWLISREAVANGSLEKFAETLPRPRGKGAQRVFAGGAYQRIDESFLEKLDEYRDTLARAFKNRNPDLDSETLTEATQRTLDRLVFMRFLEDKVIEPSPFVAKFGDRGTAWQGFVAASRRLDGIYNGIVFKKHDILDAPAFRVDDESFSDICEDLSHKSSPYDFNAIPIHILGSIYERFLGNVIVATDKRVRVEQKPDLRKAGGVYYTPNYIVRYIVENTAGKLIDGKTPDQITEMRFGDIACGSGSFLLGIYDVLLRYHAKYYNDHPRKARKVDCITSDGVLHLSLEKKREILLNNIYGVDIDAQAVEVTQLSLYLKLLEEETIASARGYQLKMHAAILPPLHKNIVCGNSLIGRDILNGQLFCDEQERTLNPMNFKDAFPEIMKNGGFDAIVGNPPYRRELDYKRLLDEIATGSFGQKHRSPRMDLWYYFVHRGLEVLKPAGRLSFIVNAYWTAGTGAAKLITALRDTAHIEEIFSFGKLRVFQNVSGQHMIFRVSNAPRSAPSTIKLAQPKDETTAEPFVTGSGKVTVLKKTAEQLFRSGKVDLQPSSDELLSKIERGTPLRELGKIRQGIAENPASINRKTNKRYGDRWEIGEGVFALHLADLKKLRLPKSEHVLLREYHDLCDLDRYWMAECPSLHLIYSTPDTCPDISAFPIIRSHLSRFRPIMEARRETRKGTNSWWHLHWPRDEQIWKAAKIIALQMARRPTFVPSRAATYVPFSVNVFVPLQDLSEDSNYIAGLLNSRLLWAWFAHYAKRRGVGLEINGNVLSRAPIRRINFSCATDKMLHEQAARLVAQMLEAKKQLAIARSDKDKNYYENKCAALDRQIDAMVYELYGLTEDEIRVVETSEY